MCLNDRRYESMYLHFDEGWDGDAQNVVQQGRSSTASSLWNEFIGATNNQSKMITKDMFDSEGLSFKIFKSKCTVHTQMHTIHIHWLAACFGRPIYDNIK